MYPGDAVKLRVSGADLGSFEEAFAASRLRGPHNRANTACAIAVARALGADEIGAAEALRTFAAPAHRMEEIRELRGVRYVNDSKATNVEATLQALASFDAPLHVILGGSLKGADFAPLAAPLAHGASAVYLIGEAAPELRRALTGWGIELVDCGTLAARRQDRRLGRRGRRRRAALAGVRLLRPVPGLRGARRALPRARRGARVSRTRDQARGAEQLLVVVAMALVAFGVVMVYSASSSFTLLEHHAVYAALGLGGSVAARPARLPAHRGARPRDARHRGGAAAARARQPGSSATAHSAG